MSISLCPAGCGATVEYAVTWSLDEVRKRGERAKRMPLDPGRRPDDDEDANIAVSGSATGGLMARVLRKGEQPLSHEHRQATHFATCPRMKAERTIPRAPVGNVIPFRRPAHAGRPR